MTSKRDAAISTTWDEARVREFLERENPRGQNIDLPYGLQTGGADRRGTAALIFPEELSGKSVLDIGPFNGFFCFEALKRGASSALGLEMDPSRVRQATQIADCLGLPAQFQLADIETDAIEAQHDYVLCLNVLHHLRNPIAALDKLLASARERLVLEVASLGARDRHKVGVSWLGAQALSHAPIIAVAPPQPKRRSQTFFMTGEGVKNLLLQHKSVAQVTLQPSQYRDRFLAIAHKRRVKQLLVVAGPAAAGKSVLIERLQNHQAPQVADALGLGNLSDWKDVTANSIDKVTNPQQNALIFHYDLMRYYGSSLRPFERDGALEVLDCADEITFLTLQTPAPILLERIEKRDLSDVKNKSRDDRAVAKRDFFRDALAVEEMYREWLQFCEQKSRAVKVARHIIVDENLQPRRHV
jgi:SAM-dependent methyltransferase